MIIYTSTLDAHDRIVSKDSGGIPFINEDLPHKELSERVSTAYASERHIYGYSIYWMDGGQRKLTTMMGRHNETTRKRESIQQFVDRIYGIDLFGGIE